MVRKKKANIEGRLCENCGLPLEIGRVVTARYCLRKACRDEINKRNNRNSIERKKRLRNGSGY